MTLVLLFAASGTLFAQSDEFAMANKFYESKDYDSAIRLYESVLKQGTESAALRFNLGNAHFKNGDLGHAVVNYLRAKRLDPADEDIRHNLEFARQFSQVRMEGVELNPINSFFASIVDPYRLNALAWVSSIFFVLLIGVLIVRYGVGLSGSLVRATIIVSLVLLVVSSGLTAFKYRYDYLTRWAVIVSDDSPVFTGPSDQAELELDGAPGLTVQILSESGEYYNVLFENKRRGWIKKDLIEEV